MSARVYVAAPLGKKMLARSIGEQLRRAGLIVTSAWHDLNLQPEECEALECSVPLRQAEAERDLSGVRSADSLLLLWAPSCRGALCEATYAYDLGKRVMIVGNRCEVTLMLDRRGVDWFTSTADAVRALERLASL